MKEEQIKKIKEELVKDISGWSILNKATYLTGVRKLNLLFHEQGAITYEEYIMLDDMLELEIKVNLILSEL